MGLNKWFEKGLTPAQYMGTLETHKEAFEHIYNQFSTSNDEQFIQNLKEKNLRAVILAEPWCGHCMLNIPILLRVAKKAEMPVKFLLRDENLELMDQYLTNGKSRTIPIMIFIDESGNEVTKWGPSAPTTRNFVEQYRKDLPEKDTEGYEDAFKEMIGITGKAFKEDQNLWLGVYEDMKKTLNEI